MVTQIKGCRDFRFICQKHSVENAARSTIGKNQLKGTKRYYSTPAINKHSQQHAEKSSNVIGPRCTSLPLQIRERATPDKLVSRRATRSANGKIQTHCSRNKSVTSPFSVRISFLSFPKTPNPPATTPVDSELALHSIANEDSQTINQCFDEIDMVTLGSITPSGIDQRQLESNNSKDDYRALESRESLHKNRYSRSEVCAGARTKETWTIQPQSSAFPLSVHKTKSACDKKRESDNIISERALQLRKYSYAGLATNDHFTKMPDTSKAMKEIPTNLFLLTHKGAKKFSFQVQNEYREADSPGIKTPRKMQSPIMINKSNGTGFDLKTKSLIIKLPGQSPDMEDFTAKENKELFGHGFHKNSVRVEGKSTKEAWTPIQSAYLNIVKNGSDEPFYIDGETKNAASQLLPQHKLKKKTKLLVSDILSSIDSYEAGRKKRILEERSSTVKGKRDSKITCKKQMKVPTKIQDVWPSKAQNSVVQARANLYDKKAAKKCYFKNNLDPYQLDDRLGRSQRDSEFIMRKRDRRTAEILNNFHN